MNSLGGRISNRQFARHLVRQLQSLGIRNSATASSVSSAEPKIQVPLRKERNATDILLALEKTISRDHTAAHYKYHDDPFLIPMSNVAKRTSALSKESGRKAAMWILKEHANLFQHKLAEPAIPAFMPKAVYNNKEEVSEELLMTMIHQGSVTDALTIYKLLEENTSVECKQALLELLCFYNNQEQLDDELIEERWYRKAATREQQIWTSSTEVEQLFEFLKKQDKLVAAMAYNTLICGTAKYLNVDRAWTLFGECESKGIPLNLTTYNFLIQLVTALRDGTPERKDLLLEMLGKINQAGLNPDVRTLTAALKVVSSMNVPNVARDLARSLFTEFKAIGVTPCLASYYYALLIFHKDRGPSSTLLRELMEELEGKTFTMQHPYDTFFFTKAMEVARYQMRDRVVAEKIHKLLLTGENYDLIGEGFKESIYYRHYMILLLKSLPFEEFMQTYELLVPHVYIPEPSVMEEIISAITQCEATVGQEMLPRLFSNMVMFDQLDRQDLLTKTIDAMRTLCAPPPDSPVHKQFADAAWTFWNYVKEQNELRRQKITWTGKLLADVALLCLRGGNFEKFLSVFSFMVKNQSSTTGIAEIDQLNEMFEACLERGDVPTVLGVLQYCVAGGFEEAVTMGRTIQSTFPLTATQEIQLNNLVGTELLKTETPDKKESAHSQRAS